MCMCVAYIGKYNTLVTDSLVASVVGGENIEVTKLVERGWSVGWTRVRLPSSPPH